MQNLTRVCRNGRLAARPFVLAVAAVFALLWTLHGAPTARADSGGSLSIQVPAQPEGPVGTNVTVAAQGATAGDKYQIAYVSPGGSCTSGLHTISGATATAASDGSFAVTFAWPNEAAQVGSLYPICAQDTTTNSAQPLQSQQPFRVDVDHAPSVSVSSSAAGQGTPATAPYAGGSDVVVSGRYFVPGQQPLEALLLTQKASGPGQLTASGGAQPLTLPDGTNMQFSADGSGAFQQHLLLPKSLAPGQYFLYVVTMDGTASTLPALAAYAEFTSAGPTPTPTATATATPVTPTAGVVPTPTSNTGSPGSGDGGAGKTIAVVALDGLSAVLLVLGVIFLASAAALPRTGMGQGGGPMRP